MTEASVRVRLPTKFPANVTADLPIVITRTHGTYNFSFSGADLTTDEIDGITFIMEGAGTTLTTGLKGYLEIPFACTLTRATLLADETGSIVVDIFKCTYTDFDVSTHPVVGDKITDVTPPTITAAVKSQDVDLTNWTKTIVAGDILGFSVTSVTSIQRVTLSLKVSR